MRAVLALTLLGVVAGHDHHCPIMDWLKEHGPGVIDTVKECKDMPAVMKQAMDPECRGKTTALDKVAMGAWYAITVLEHAEGTKIGEFAKRSKAVAKLKKLATMKSMSALHDTYQNYCGKGKCQDLANNVRATVSPCYASLMCNFMGEILPFDKCKTAFTNYMERGMEITTGNMCGQEEMKGKKYYCSELDVDLELKDFDCFMEIKMPHLNGTSIGTKLPTKCTPKCVKTWDAMKAKFPKCTKDSQGMMQKMMKNMMQLMEDVSKDIKSPHMDAKEWKKIMDEVKKMKFSNYDETCDHAPHTVVV